ncbi:MAG TPA: hypothetical protein VFU31_02400 [Candidatus Binatia bacterium]|nr:hypothetical protein [Candidatus Binatia bacterium]
MPIRKSNGNASAANMKKVFEKGGQNFLQEKETEGSSGKIRRTCHIEIQELRKVVQLYTKITALLFSQL